MDDRNYMRISELVELSGVPKSTIHFYLREGLIHPPLKTGKTMGYYDETHLARLQEIMTLKGNRGMPIVFIKQQLDKRDKRNKKNLTADSIQNAKESKHIDLKNRRKQLITQAGIRIFSKKGYHQTRIKDITDELNISTGTYYTYFANKKELFVEVINEVILTIVEETAEATKHEKDFFHRAIIRGKVFFDNYSKYREILSLLRTEIASEDIWAKEKVDNVYRQLTLPLIQDLQQAMDEGTMRKIDPDLFAYALAGLIESMSQRVTMDQKYDFDKIINFIADLLANGLFVPTGDRKQVENL